MRKLFMVSIFSICLSTVFAQDYNTGIGLRGGYFKGVTFKHFISDNKALEVLAGTHRSGMNLTLLYQIHNNAFGVERLNWYYGGGGHIGFRYGANAERGTRGEPYSVIGIDGILGMEYNFKEIPINLSLDWKPALNLIGHSGFWGTDGALSIRFIF